MLFLAHRFNSTRHLLPLSGWFYIRTPEGEKRPVIEAYILFGDLMFTKASRRHHCMCSYRPLIFTTHQDWNITLAVFMFGQVIDLLKIFVI